MSLHNCFSTGQGDRGPAGVAGQGRRLTYSYVVTDTVTGMSKEVTCWPHRAANCVGGGTAVLPCVCCAGADKCWFYQLIPCGAIMLPYVCCVGADKYRIYQPQPC